MLSAYYTPNAQPTSRRDARTKASPHATPVYCYLCPTNFTGMGDGGQQKGGGQILPETTRGAGQKNKCLQLGTEGIALMLRATRTTTTMRLFHGSTALIPVSSPVSAASATVNYATPRQATLLTTYSKAATTRHSTAVCRTYTDRTRFIDWGNGSWPLAGSSDGSW